MAQFEAAFRPRFRAVPVCAAWALAGGLLAGPALGHEFPITPAQRATAEQVALAGVPISELAPNAPDTYTVKRGDTLWAIARIFLKSPWRWPQLWGMNLQAIRNPHRIYPGQQLVLDRIEGRATLRLGPPSQVGPGETVRLSPRTRVEATGDSSLPTLQPHLIEPFLNEALIVDELTLSRAPRIVATTDSRVLITRGDRAYARGMPEAPLMLSERGGSDTFRIFRNVKPLRDPVTQAILGYEASYLGQGVLARGEAVQAVKTKSGESQPLPVPATIDIVTAREEIRVGDRLVPEPPRQLLSYVPRAPDRPVDGAIVSVYGDAVALAGPNQVVVINKGTSDGIGSGHVLAILKAGPQLLDRSQPGERTQIKLPDERNGLLMVFRPFEKLSYALVLETSDGVKIGDRLINPR